MRSEEEHQVRGRMKAIWFGLCVLGLVSVLAGTNQVWGQLPEPGSQSTTPNPLVDTTMSPGKMLLFDLEAKFAKDVAARGGAAFADWFAPDGITLGNGAPPVVGKVAIAKATTWTPQQYQLTWTPTDAAMGPSGDMGYTWGHFEGHSKDANGNPQYGGISRDTHGLPAGFAR